MTFEEKTLESKYVYKGKIFNVRQDIVTAPNGQTATRDIIEHRGGVGIAAVTKDKKIVLIKQFRKAAEEVLWEIPAGKIEPEEVGHLSETAQRELKEETGYNSENLEYLGGFFGTCGYDNEVIHLYYADATDKGETHFDPTEAIDTYEIEISKALEMLKSGEIKDGKTAIAVLMIARRFNV
ncbi:MAG: NUDIX hydrolase [Bacillota bacterium]|nr:NUDIX hydrolase [Bacillota bacterium]